MLIRGNDQKVLSEPLYVSIRSHRVTRGTETVYKETTTKVTSHQSLGNRLQTKKGHTISWSYN